MAYFSVPYQEALKFVHEIFNGLKCAYDVPTLLKIILNKNICVFERFFISIFCKVIEKNWML